MPMGNYLEDIPETPSGTAEDAADAGDSEPEANANDDKDAESFEDSESDTSLGEESGSSEPYPEKPDRPVSGAETVSGNSADYPYGSSEDASTHAAYDSGGTDSILLIEVMERQNDILIAGFASIIFILGTILGVLVIHGFRLRRV